MQAISTLLAHEFLVLPRVAPDFRDSGTNMANPDKLKAGESGGIPDMVSWAGVLDASGIDLMTR